MSLQRPIATLLLAAALAAAPRAAIADPAEPVAAAAARPPRREVRAADPEGIAIPDAARVALGISAIGTVVGLVSIPNADTEPQGPTTTLTVVSFGVGLAGLAAAGIIIWAAPDKHVTVAASPGAVQLHGSF